MWWQRLQGKKPETKIRHFSFIHVRTPDDSTIVALWLSFLCLHLKVMILKVWFNNCGSDRNPLITFKHNLKVVAIGKYKNQWLPTWQVFTRSSFIVISWPWERVKIYEIDQWLPTWLMPIYIQNSWSLSNSIQCSIYRTEPGNAFAWIILTAHASAQT